MFSTDELCSFLAETFDEDVTESFRKNKITGSTFMKLSEQQIEKMVTAIGDVVELRALQSRVKKELDLLAEPVCSLTCY